MSHNPHALDTAQDDAECFEVMLPPPTDEQDDSFDMYHDRPSSAGFTKARKQVHRDGDWHRSVHVWVVDLVRREVVLQQRSPHKDTFPNRWDISAAGHIENGADSKETAIRELAEELGVEDASSSTDSLTTGEQQNQESSQPSSSTTLPGITFAFTCPAEQAPWGGCNCYEDVYFLQRDKESCKFAIGEAEVTAVKWIKIDELRARWEANHPDYVPRVPKYREAFFKTLADMQQ